MITSWRNTGLVFYSRWASSLTPIRLQAISAKLICSFLGKGRSRCCIAAVSKGSERSIFFTCCFGPLRLWCVGISNSLHLYLRFYSKLSSSSSCFHLKVRYQHIPQAMSYDAVNLATPEIKWLGLHDGDLKRWPLLPKCFTPLSDKDRRKGELMLSMPALQAKPKWRY